MYYKNTFIIIECFDCNPKRCSLVKNLAFLFANSKDFFRLSKINNYLAYSNKYVYCEIKQKFGNWLFIYDLSIF